jgi:hypothetical protein
VHITVGLVDERVRLSREDYQRIQVHFLAGREDVFLILHRENSECTLMLSARDSVRLFTTQAGPNAKVPQGVVSTLDMIRRQMIAGEARTQARTSS